MENGRDQLVIGGKSFNSRFILGSGGYHADSIRMAVDEAGVEIVTMSVRRAQPETESILNYIPDHVTLMANTSGARDAREAVRAARLARELGASDFVKVEIMRDPKYMTPDNLEVVRATEELAEEGFKVLACVMPDLYIARDLINSGAAAVMPIAAPRGSNRGLASKEFIQMLINEIDIPVIIDAGLGRPSQACEVMEMGADAVSCNSGVATSGNIPMMAKAFGEAVRAGRRACLAGLGRVLEAGASPFPPVQGFISE